jgi:hypothetical protein
MKKDGLDVKYDDDGRILVEGCEDGYMIAHYQEPRNMMCLWDKFQKKQNEEHAARSDISNNKWIFRLGWQLCCCPDSMLTRKPAMAH